MKPICRLDNFHTLVESDGEYYLIAGPIMRWRHFRKDMEKTKPQTPDSKFQQQKMGQMIKDGDLAIQKYELSQKLEL